MRVLVDVLSAPADSGGMRSYALEVLTAWTAGYPDDQFVVIGPPWVREEFEGSNADICVVHRGGSLGRLFAQLFLTPVVFWLRRVDALVALGPVVTPFVPRRLRVCVVHDWRHMHHPEEFSRQVLLFRRLWVPLIQTAGAVVVISEKTRRETQGFAPRARPILIESGRDHPQRWGVLSAPSGPSSIVTFGHRAAKRPEMVMRAAALLAPEPAWRLSVLGATGQYAAELAELAAALGISERVDLPGFVSDACYRQYMADAHVVVVASTDEGFGLPLVEAQYFGAHSIATADSGLGDIHGSRVVLVASQPESIAAALAHSLSLPRSTGVAAGPTWVGVASGLRQLAIGR